MLRAFLGSQGARNGTLVVLLWDYNAVHATDTPHAHVQSTSMPGKYLSCIDIHHLAIGGKRSRGKPFMISVLPCTWAGSG